MTDKVLVKAMRAEYPVSGGGPIMVMGGSGSGGGRGAVGVTRGQRVLGGLGTAVGVLGALAGQHRSLGGLAQSAISGGAQGSALGRGLGRMFTTREGQARANLREERKQAEAMERARVAEDVRNRGEGPMSRFNPMDAIRRRNVAVVDRAQQRLDRANLANRSMDAARQQVNEELTGRVAAQRRAAEKRAASFERGRAKAAGAEFGEKQRRNAEAFEQMMNMMGTNRRRWGQGAAEVQAAEFEEVDPDHPSEVADPDHPSEVVVTDAAGKPLGNASEGVRALPPPSPTVTNAAAELSRDEGNANSAAAQQTIGVTDNDASKEQEEAFAYQQRPKPQPSQPQDTTVQTELPFVGVRGSDTAGMSGLQRRSMGAA